jgi:predicted DNA-binding transcriptional regulator AlpA
MSDNSEDYLTGPDVDRRYNRSSQTRWRWSKDPDLGFPKPIRIKNRLFYRRSEIEEWERCMAAASGRGRRRGAMESRVEQEAMRKW